MSDADQSNLGTPVVEVTTNTPSETSTTEKFVTVSTTSESPDEIQTKETTVKVNTGASTSSHELRELSALESYVRIIKANPLYSEAAKLMQWRDPVKSGLLFGIFNFFFILYTFADYSLVTIVSYVLLTLLTISIGYANYVVLKASWLQGKRVENPFQERFKDTNFHVSRQTAEKHMDTVLDFVNTTADLFRDVFYCTDNFLSARFFVYFYIGATLGNWFSGATLVYLVTLGLFVWPRLYEEKKREIDHFYGIAKTQATTYFNLALTKLPPAVTAKFPALKPKNN